jgi:outer membrane protein TolC
MGAEQAEAQARLALAQAQGNQYQDVAALFQALGGGWWNEPGAGKGLPAP